MTEAPTATRIPETDEFPITWTSPHEPKRMWRWDQSHVPHAMTPLGVELAGRWMTRMQNTMGETGMPLAGSVWKAVNGFLYLSGDAPEGSPEEVMARVQKAVMERGFTMYKKWQDEYEDEVVAINQRFLDFDYAGASLVELAELCRWMLEKADRTAQIHGSIVVGMAAATPFAGICKNLFGLEKTEAYELLRGAPNLSVESGSKLWQLAHGASTDVQATIRDNDSAAATKALQQTEEGRTFLVALGDYLHVHGWRIGNFDIIEPSWVEDPKLGLDQVRNMLRVAVDPEIERQELQRTVNERIEELRGRLADDQRGLFNIFLAGAQQYTPLQEDHNHHIDQKFFALRRLPMRQVGLRMVAAGLIAVADDFPFVTLDELLAFLDGDATDRKGAVRERKAEFELWTGVVPPAVIGTMPVEDPIAGNPFFAEFFGANVEQSDDPKIVNGMAAVRGTVTGTARVIRSLTDSHRIKEGDILVCDMTTPAWTPLFPSLAGIVADSGGPLSHCAIVAREYGIPCVVATRVGSQVIPDGATITVDGAQGIIRIES